jgi:hypothetical protein
LWPYRLEISAGLAVEELGCAAILHIYTACTDRKGTDDACSGGAPGGSSEFSQDHVAWVAQALIRMGTIKPGMTRQELLTVFTIEGGLSTGLQRTFVSRDCPYFKIDVQFKAVGRQDRDREGRVTLVEDSKDIVVKISRPYLQFSVLD